MTFIFQGRWTPTGRRCIVRCWWKPSDQYDCSVEENYVDLECLGEETRMSFETQFYNGSQCLFEMLEQGMMRKRKQ